MKLIKKLLAVAAVAALMVTASVAFAGQSCCAKAKAGGKDCSHPCCVEAHKAKKTCDKCQKEASCCDKAIAKGEACAHPCCAEATKEKKVCAKCNPEDKK